MAVIGSKGCDWLLNSMKPVKCLVYKRIVKFEFRNELLNFATNFRTSQQSSKSYSEKEFSQRVSLIVEQLLGTNYPLK